LQKIPTLSSLLALSVPFLPPGEWALLPWHPQETSSLIAKGGPEVSSVPTSPIRSSSAPPSCLPMGPHLLYLARKMENLVWVQAFCSDIEPGCTSMGGGGGWRSLGAGQSGEGGGMMWGWSPFDSHYTTQKLKGLMRLAGKRIHNFKLHFLLCSSPAQRGPSAVHPS
jgi:hypothetical protein